MYCVVFVDVHGVMGEFRAGANYRQAKALVDKVFCPKGQQPSRKTEDASKQIGLQAPIVWYKIVKRRGKSSSVGMVVPEPACEESVREESVRFVCRKKVSEDLTLLVSNA